MSNVAELDTNSKPGRNNAVRAVAGVLAALVIAFCGWSAFEYASGGDPLAFLGGTAFQTVEEDAGSSQGSASDGISLKTVSNTVTSDDVTAQIAKLTYGGKDVSVAADNVNVVIADGGIWVENACDDDAATAVDAAARRVAALAAWADEQQVSITHVVWICEDMAGSVRAAIDYPAGRESKGETAAQILAAADGYRISGDTYAALGSDPAFKQEGGEAPSLPDGNAVTVISEKTSSGEVLEATSETYTVFTTDSGNGTGSAGSKKGSGSSSSSGSGSASGSSSQSGSGSSSADSKITVTVTVDGSAVGAGSSSASVALASGSSVYDALKATGVSINATDTQYGIYVAAIGGLAEKEYGGTSGWMYSVNGVTPMTSCANYTLKDGDTIVWHYVTSD